MLGLRNTLVSNYCHRRQYSLSLDGANDWLDIGDNWDPHQNDFSISLWFKADSDSGTADILFSKFVDNDNKIEIGINGSNKLFAQAVASTNNAINNTAGTELDALGLNWIHVVLTMNRDGNGKLYVNGSTSTYGISMSAQNDTQNLNNTGSIYIGARSDGNLDFPGKIDEVAIFNGSLSETSVATIYNEGPFDLNYDRGNYTNSSNLHGYWRMGNGLFDDRQNGVVHDAHNPGFGNENIDLTTGSSTQPSEWSSATTNGVSKLSGGTSVTYYDTGFNTVTGKTYKISCTISNYESDTNTDLGFSSTGGIGSTVRIAGNGTVTHIFQATSVVDVSLFGRSTNTGTFSNVSVKQLNGYPGITNADATFSTDTPSD